MRGVSVAPIGDRMDALTAPEPNSGCWLWVGAVKANGYGTIGIKDKGAWRTKHAHRLSYERHVGPIPAGLDLDHKCRNRCCVNPLHLEPVTRSVNLSRSPLMGHRKAGTVCPRGHTYTSINTRGARTCRICSNAAAAKYRAKRDHKS